MAFFIGSSIIPIEELEKNFLKLNVPLFRISWALLSPCHAESQHGEEGNEFIQPALLASPRALLLFPSEANSWWSCHTLSSLLCSDKDVSVIPANTSCSTVAIGVGPSWEGHFISYINEKNLSNTEHQWILTPNVSKVNGRFGVNLPIIIQ